MLQDLNKQFKQMRGRLNYEIDKTGNMAKAELYRMAREARKDIYFNHINDIPQDGRILSDYMSGIAIKRLLSQPTLSQQLHKMGWK